MTARHTTHGNSRPWIVATSYKHESPQYARFERQEARRVGWFWPLLALALVASCNHALRVDMQAHCGGGFEHEGC